MIMNRCTAKTPPWWLAGAQPTPGEEVSVLVRTAIRIDALIEQEIGLDQLEPD
jgi:hypothetical protein